MYKGVIDRYKKFLPVNEKTPIITLYEGNTPLLRAKNLESYLKVNFELYLKCEGFNPTGSFKDRGMTVAISKALEEKDNPPKAVICASTGNTAASAAAYAAKANLKCIVLIPEGAIAFGKLSQAIIHGAEIIPIKGNFDTALRLVKEICAKYPIKLVNSINPDRIEGQKTAAFEIIDELGYAPDYQFMPVGNAGNITAYWKGYKEFAEGKFKLKVESENPKEKHKNSNSQLLTFNLPHMMGFQAEGAAPIVLGKPIRNPKTIATAIRIGNPASWKGACQARDESGGVIDTVTDNEIIAAYKLLAELEGIFVEPASAASVAGLIKYSKKILQSRGQKKGLMKQQQGHTHPLTIVCILTGHGLKDPDRAIKSIKVRPKSIEPTLSNVIRAIKL